jgi:hypothetical protein
MKPRLLTAAVLGLSAVLFSAAGASAAAQKKDRDIFDHAAFKAAKGVTKIAFIADTRPHGGRGNHEFVAAAVYLARTINANYPKAYAVVYTNNHLPKDLTGVAAIVTLYNNAGPVADSKAVQEAVARGAGFMAIHYGVEVHKGKQGERFLKWMGGYFEQFWSVNPFWTPEFKEIPKHETTRGVKPFTINDEWYYHMRFVSGMKGVTPILSAVAPVKSITARWKVGSKPDGYGGNPAVYKEVAAGKKQVMAWAYERPDGGRGFGFTGLHKHDNLGNDNMRTLLLNAVAWVAKLPVPPGGVPSTHLDRSALEQLIDEGRLAVKRRGI